MQKSHTIVAVLMTIALAAGVVLAIPTDSSVSVTAVSGPAVPTTAPLTTAPLTTAPLTTAPLTAAPPANTTDVTTASTPAPIPTAAATPAAPATTGTTDPAPAPPATPAPATTATPEPTSTVIPTPTPTPIPESTVALVFNPDLAPTQGTAGPAVDGGPDRPVARFVDDEGVASDLVLGELVVSTNDPASLDGFLHRHNATVISTTTTTQSDIADYLVSIPSAIVDPALAAARLTEVEPDHTGTYQLSDPSIIQLIAIAAAEQADFGLETSINWIVHPNSIADGDVSEDASIGNPFESEYLRIGGSFDTGVTGAWQLLTQHDKLDNTVEILVADGGFFENADFPAESKIRLAGWNENNPNQCGGPCPTHGTDVSLTAVAQVDNDFGVAGVAGPVASLVAVQLPVRDIFTQFRKIRNTVEEERPDVVNMSFSAEIKLFRAASQASVDRVLGDIAATGAIIFAGSGNAGTNVDGTRCLFGVCYENRLYVPCESKHAICVGGLQSTSGTETRLDPGSNYGSSGGNRSVELYAPFCVRTVSSFVTGSTRQVCGTSFSSPFVAGTAALVLAANPSLSRGEVKSILLDTAHIGGVQSSSTIPTNTQRRVNALDAVIATLGVTEGPPVVTITSHDDFDQVTPRDWVDLRATAHDYKGQPLAVSWESSIEGNLGTSQDTVSVFELTAGTHTIVARVTDVNGIERSDSINLIVVDNPPELTISWPPPGTTISDGTDITLVGGSLDPDTNQFLDDADVEWELLRNGQVHYDINGHHGFVSGNAMTPGDYTVRFTGTKDSVEGVAESTLTVKALPPGEDAPSADILNEFQELPYGSYSGQLRTFDLDGIGTDPQDGVLSGTRMRWIAYSEGYQEVLCTGSSWDTFAEPEPEDDEDGEDGDSGFGIGNPTFIAPDVDRPPIIGAPDLTLLRDCSQITVELGLLPQHPVVTHYTIVLQVRDSAGLIGQDISGLTIGFVTG